MGRQVGSDCSQCGCDAWAEGALICCYVCPCHGCCKLAEAALDRCWTLCKVTLGLLCCLYVNCVQVLQQLASLQPAVDEEGSVLQPLPRAHRGIADPACLPHIAQVMLTGELWTSC